MWESGHDPQAVRAYTSRMNVYVFAVLRFPVSQEKTSFVSASIAMNVQPFDGSFVHA